MYQDALDRHRKTNNSYWCPTDPVKLKVNQTECIKVFLNSYIDAQRKSTRLTKDASCIKECGTQKG